MPVLSELATMTEVAQGTSLARFGHGELAIMAGEDARLQKYDPKLAMELRAILNESPCLVCVPHTRGKNGWQWERFLREYGRDIRPERWYGSSFVSRADEVGWTDEYVKLIRGDGLAKSGQLLPAPSTNAFLQIDQMESHALDLVGKIYLRCGPTATVLADRLTRKGKWALDIGNIRQFL